MRWQLECGCGRRRGRGEAQALLCERSVCINVIESFIGLTLVLSSSHHHISRVHACPLSARPPLRSLPFPRTHQYAMPAALVTESKDFEPEGPDKPKIKAGTWDFYHFHSNQIHLHVQQQVLKDDAPISALNLQDVGLHEYIGVVCYSHSIDRDVRYFYEKFLQRTMDEGNPSISQTKCTGNARLD